MKREESRYAIRCDSDCGPIFGNDDGSDIHIGDKCNTENSCYIKNNGIYGYECNSEHKEFLFVNSTGTDGRNEFSVADYEVFGIDFEDRDNIYKLYKHPDILWEYITTKTISEESLKQFGDDIDLLNDLDALHYGFDNLPLKISQMLLRNPSEYLPNTQIVDKQYDSYLREWIGDCKWKLLFRASEHEYSTHSFHKYCNDQNPTLVIIKSTGGWIFGGYTTNNWEGTGIC